MRYGVTQECDVHIGRNEYRVKKEDRGEKEERLEESSVRIQLQIDNEAKNKYSNERNKAYLVQRTKHTVQITGRHFFTEYLEGAQNSQNSAEVDCQLLHLVGRFSSLRYGGEGV